MRAVTRVFAQGKSVPRRRALQALGALGLSGCSSGGAARGQGASPGATGACVLTPAQAEGPFFFDTRLERRDVRDGKPGTELQLGLRLLEAGSCSAIAGAVVELWHADADGVYSAFDAADGNSADAAGQTFLRGFQTSDEGGRVEFRTIYPGWYPGRAVHVHVMIVLTGERLLTTQLYFDDALTAEVYASEPYATRGLPDTTNAADGLAPTSGTIQTLLVDAALEAGTYAGQVDLTIDLG